MWTAARYALFSRDVIGLARRGFDLGIDVLGSHFGAMLLARAGVRRRMGVRGYAGGHLSMPSRDQIRRRHTCEPLDVKVCRGLGTDENDLPKALPQVFLSPDESAEGEDSGAEARERCEAGDWLSVPGVGRSISIGQWADFVGLVRRLSAELDVSIALVGALATGPQPREWRRTTPGRSISAANCRYDRRLHWWQPAMQWRATAVCCSTLRRRFLALTPSSLDRELGDPAQHFRQWCYPGLSHYPSTCSGNTIAGPREAAELALQLLR